MDNVLKKLCLSAHKVRIIEEKILTNIVCYLSVEDFLKLGFSDRNAVMFLRIECLTFGLCTPEMAVRITKFVITKVLVKIDDVFSAKKCPIFYCVSERTVLRLMVEYGLKIFPIFMMTS